MKLYFVLKSDWQVSDSIYDQLNDRLYTDIFWENRLYGEGVNEISFGINISETYSSNKKVEALEKMKFMSKNKYLNFQIYLNFEQFMKGDKASNIEQLIKGFVGCFTLLAKRKIENFDIEAFQKDFFLFLVSRKMINVDKISW